MAFVKKNIKLLLTLILTVLLLSVSLFAWFTNNQTVNGSLEGSIIGQGINGEVYYYNYKKDEVTTNEWTPLTTETEPFQNYLPGDIVYFRIDLTLTLSSVTNITINPSFEETGFNSYVVGEGSSETYFLDEAKLNGVTPDSSFDFESALIQLFDGLEYTYFELNTENKTVDDAKAILNPISTNRLKAFTTTDNKTWLSPSSDIITLSPNETKSIVYAIKFREDSDSFYIRSSNANITIDGRTYLCYSKSPSGNSNVFKYKTIKLNTFRIS